MAGFIVAFTLVRLCFAPVAELLPEEAYYWIYAKHPAWGYFDHPPMVAWIIRLGTFLWGDNEVGVRFVTIVLWGGTCGLVHWFTAIWFPRKTAFWTTILYAVLPVFSGTGFIVTPDEPLLFSWLLAMCAFSRALKTDSDWWWALGGVASGAALLSKYYALGLGLSIAVILLCDPQYRRWILKPQPWCALGLALLMFVPVILWNSQHRWASFLFQIRRPMGPEPRHLANIANFWLIQLGMVTPLVLAAVVGTLWIGFRRIRSRADKRWLVAVGFSLPLFAVFALASVTTQIRVNWTAPAYLSILPGVVHLWRVRNRHWELSARAKRWERYGLGATVLGCVVVLLVGAASLAWGVPRYAHAGTWQATADAVETAEAELEKETGLQAFVLDPGQYEVAAEVGFYSQEPDEEMNSFILGEGGLGYKYWTIKPAHGLPAVAVFDRLEPWILRRISEHFERVGELKTLQLSGRGWHRRTIYLLPCYGYLGAKRHP